MNSIKYIIDNNIGILCKNIEDVKMVSNTLIYNGYNVYAYSNIEKDWDVYPYFVYSESGEYFVQSRSSRNKISAQEFLQNFTKKLKKNPELDPYEEDFWGWEDE